MSDNTEETPAPLLLPARGRKRRGALQGKVGDSFEPMIPSEPTQPTAVPTPEARPVEVQAEPVAPAAPTMPAITPEMQRQAYQQQYMPVQQMAPQPAPVPPKPPRKPRPVTTGKLALNLPLETMERLDNTFSHLYLTGQIERKSHLVNQAIIELCERMEAELNNGDQFPASALKAAPTGAPRKITRDE